MDKEYKASESPAASITKAASKQTYYTIRLFVDRERIPDAYRAYGYFRWVDDVIDAETGSGPVLSEVEAAEKVPFVNRQKSLLDACYRGNQPDDLSSEERMLADLVDSDTETNSGLQSYLRNMMDVMIFDAERRGRVISQAELSEYSKKLGTSVTEALHYFIGHDDPSPHHEARYHAVTAAHITHMLRDTYEDTDTGYFNIPHEYLQTRGISPQDVKTRAYRKWVCARIQLARRYFKTGRECIAQVRNPRCRLAGYAYIARFEWMLRTIERDNYCLRSEYPDRKSLWAGLWMGWSTLAPIFASPWTNRGNRNLAIQPARFGKR